MLVLFDIDGTLVRSGGAGRKALERAFQELYSVEDALSQVRLDGNTDRRIVEEMFETKLGRAPTDAEASALSERYLENLQREVSSADGRYEVLPGVYRLLAALETSAHAVIGLATGNLERGARTKLEPGDLNRYFAFGGFGSDARIRTDIVRVAMQRGSERHWAQYGRAPMKEEIWVLGDTERDVIAAREAGAMAVGILAGAHAREKLVDAQPDLVVETMGDAELWTRLGL